MTQPPKVVSSPSDARILVVDDDRSVLDFLVLILKHGGYSNIRACERGKEALDLVASFDPDLVLLDLLMPEMDGLAVLAEIRRRAAPDDELPVLLLTAMPGAESKRRALELGASDFLAKPCDANEMLLRIRNLIRLRRQHHDLRSQKARLEQEVRERSAQLVANERLATMHTLLSGVAHELNNPLSVVLGQAALLHTSSPAQVRERAEKINAAAERCARIISNFVAIARHKPAERRPLDLNRTTREALELCAYLLRIDDVQVELDFAASIPPILGDTHQISQALVNLISNAQQALRDAAKPRKLRLTTTADAASQRVHLTVADNGPGVPTEVHALIFEPFFTTKAAGEGTGLGLSFCRAVVEGHGGTIRLESTPGAGTSFHLEFPAARAPAQNLPVARSQTRPARILVVDDEQGIVDLIREILALDGHKVETARHGAEALERLEKSAFDLVLSDVRMPVMDGPRLYDQLLLEKPELARTMVFLTGDSLSPDVAAFLERSGSPILGKPFTPTALREAVRTALSN